MDKNFVTKLLLLVPILLLAVSLVGISKLNAVSGLPSGCEEPFGIPTACKTPCGSLNETNCYVPDFQCSNAKILNPQTVCCPNKCNGSGTIGTIGSGDQTTLSSFNVFGTKFSFSPSSIPSLINAIISTFLGIVSLYALGRGAYIGAVIRSNAITAEDIEKVNKEIINLIIGFVLAWSFIFIIQFVASVLGIGKLTDLNVTNTGTEIVIK